MAAESSAGSPSEPVAWSAVTTRCADPPSGPPTRVTSAKGVAVRAHAAAASSHGCARASTATKASVATPPQHCPRRAASGKRTIHAAGTDACVSASRAMRMASNSRWPPPIVPNVACSATIIAVPAARGVEPDACAIVTSTARPSRPSRAASSGTQSAMREPRGRAGRRRRQGCARPSRAHRAAARAGSRSTLASASLNAWNPASASMNGGSPTAFERWIVSSRLGSPKNATLKRAGTSCAVGILYVEGACVFNSPLAFHHSSSIASQPQPWMKPPSTCPRSMAGLSDVPTSCRMSTPRSRCSPVSVSIATSATAAPYAK